MPNHTTVRTADDVTDEIITMAQSIYAGWFGDGQRIDWHDFMDRLDGVELADGSTLDLGDTMDSPAIRKIQREILAFSKL